MSAPVPENVLNGTDTHTVGEQMGMLGPVAGQPSAEVLQNFANSKVGPNVAALLSAIKAPKAELSTFHTAPDAVAKGNNGGDFWSAAKNVIDFISTPFYMATNAANNIVKDHASGNPDADSLGAVLNDIGKGIGQGYDAGVNHNPDNAKDWNDVIQNDPKSPVTADPNMRKSFGFALDMLGDPLNLVPGTGVVGGAARATVKGLEAIREAGGAARVALREGADAAASGAKAAAGAAKGAETASDAAAVSGTGAGVQTAQKGAQALDPAARVKEFESIPGIANALENQGRGKLGAFANAFGSTFKDSVQNSELGKFLDSIRQNFKNAPIPVTPENVVLSHVKGVENAPRLAEQPVASMAPVEAVNPEKAIAEKHLGENGHDLYKSIQDAIASTNWVRPPTEFRQAQTDYKAYIDAARNNAQDMSQALSFEQFVDKVHPGAKADLTIADPFAKGSIQVSQKYLREMAPEGERQAVARAIGIPENTPPAELTNKFFALKNKYLEAKKEIDGLYKKDPETTTAEATKQAVKQQDIRNSAVSNTLADSAWNNMTPEQRQATRAANAKMYMDKLNEPAKLSVYGDSGPGLKPVSPATQQKIAASSVDEVMKLQQAQLENRTKQGYRMTAERATGKNSSSGIVHPLLYNTQSNQRMLQTIVRKAKTELNAILKNSGARISKFPKGEGLDLAGFSVREMRAAESAIQALGMIPHLAMGRLKDETGAIHLFLGDIFEAMLAHNDIKGKGIVSANILRKHFFGAGESKSINSQAFLTAVEGLLRERKLIHEEMAKAGGALSPERMKELTDKAKERVHGALLNKDKYYNESRTGAERKNIEASIDKYSSRTDYAHDMKILADSMVDDPHFGAMLEQRHLYNEALHKADLEKYAQNNWADIEKTLNSYGTMNWTPQEMIKWVNEHIKGAKDVLPYSDKTAYSDDINVLKQEHITPAEEKAATASFGDNTVSKDTTDTVVQEVADDRAKNPSVIPATLSDIRLGEIATDTLRAIHPVRSFFDAKYPFAASGFYGEVIMGSHSRARIQNLYHQTIQSHIMKYSKADTLLNDFRAVQKAAVEGTELEAGTSAHELSQITNVLFSEDNPWVKGLSDGTLPKRYFEDVLESKMALRYIDSDWWEAAKGPELADLWKHLNLENSTDAADFFSNMHSTLAQIYNDRAIAHSFEKQFGSTVAKDGYVKLTWTNKGKNTKIIKNRGYTNSRFSAERQPGLWEILNKDLYYEKTAAQEIPAIHRLMNESRKVSNDTAIGKFTNHILDPVTQVMKVFQTTLRPGHWVSNFLGDSIRLHMAGVYDPKAYAYNLAILKSLGKDEGLYTTPVAKFERITRTAQKDYSFKLPKDIQPGDIPLKFSDGTKSSISQVELGRMLEDIGVYMAPHGFGQHEDFINELERGTAGKVVNAVNNTMDKVINVGGKFSLNKMGALRDNINRGPLALNILFNGSYKDINDLRAQMSAVVRKWAPTSQDFTREESMYARRAVFYYTWLRGMLPNILETLVEKPGVYNAPNRALYAWSKANDVEPMSIGNPFPANKMFPTYYYENVIGPQIQAQGGALWGFSPMAPSIDVLDTMMNGVNSESAKQGNMLQAVGNNFASMLSPFAKIPFEAISGQSGNVPIKDTGQYLQDQLLPPQLDLISKISGQELYNGQNRTDKGNKEAFQGVPLDLWNFLSGTHTTDYTSPAATRAAIGELRTDRSTIKADNKRANR